MRKDAKPVLAITMGDPAGTGPEIIAKAAATPTVQNMANIVVVGDGYTMQRAVQTVGADCQIWTVARIEDAQFAPGRLTVLDLHNVDPNTLQLGQIQASAGQAAFEYIVRSIELAMQRQVDGVVTSAIHKEALHLAGHKFDGHTEIFAQLTGSKKVTMMLAAGDFRVTHVSTHCSLRQAIERCKPERILDVIRLTDEALKRMGFSAPRIAVAGLNPHSGEQGLFGTEDMEFIQPAIDQARSEGFDVSPRPEPPDTVFVRMLHGKVFDAVVAQYHDQGHIAAKIVDFFNGVNITLGLPIIRTSVDHGTAFDIAGTGKANPTSLISAIRYACRLSGAVTD